MPNSSTGIQDSRASISKVAPISWSVSEQIYEQIDSDIKINRLLATYHPDDGIVAYERILRAFGTSSESVITDTWQQLIQTLPLPSGASENDVKEVISKVTGLSKDSLMFCNETEIPREQLSKEKTPNCHSKNVNQYQNSFNNDGIHSSAVKFMQLEDNKPKCASSISEEFLGFPPQEISVTTNRIQNGQNLKNILSSSCTRSQLDLPRGFDQKDSQSLGLKFKWLHPQRVLHKGTPYQSAAKYRQTVLNTLGNKYIQLSIAKLSNYNQVLPNLRAGPKIQTQVSDSQIRRNKLENTPSLEIRKADISDFKWDYSNVSSDNQQICTVGINEKIEDELKVKQQEDINKMDFVRWYEDSSNFSSDIQSSSWETLLADNLTVSERLKSSMVNFLKRAEQDIAIEVQSVPAIKSFNSESSRTISPCANPETKKQTIVDCNAEYTSAVDPPRKHKDINISDSIKKFIRKKPLGINSNLRSHQSNAVPLQNLAHRMKASEQHNRAVLHPTASDFATLKKQYCDALFNIQKTKVVIANSISSVESNTRVDPCYSNCSYQRQLLHKEEQLMRGPQFAVHTVPQSGLLNIRSVPCTWLRYGNWKQPIMSQLKFQQQVTYCQSEM